MDFFPAHFLRNGPDGIRCTYLFYECAKLASRWILAHLILVACTNEHDAPHG
jgi:hypothetical protein